MGEPGLLLTLVLVFLAGYLVGRGHAGRAGRGSGAEGRRRWRMRADNNVTRRTDARPHGAPQPVRQTSASQGARATSGRRSGFAGFMDAINIESLVAAVPTATQGLIREGDRDGAARSLLAAYPTMSQQVVKDAVDTWAARNGLR
jgi:hypothetical protein